MKVGIILALLALCGCGHTAKREFLGHITVQQQSCRRDCMSMRNGCNSRNNGMENACRDQFGECITTCFQ